MGKTNATGLKRIIDAAGYSWKGYKAAYRHEAAFRQEIWLLLILAPLAFMLGENWSEIAILIASLLFVLVVELLNSCIEAVVDRISDKHHELSGRAKDMGSAAVLTAITITALIWVALLLN